MTTTTWHKIVAVGGAALLALALSAALAAGQTSGAPTTSASYVPPTDSMSGQSMLELLVRTNRETIRQARSVVAGSRDADIRRFAQTQVDDHSGVLNRANALWDRLNYTRADSVTTRSAMPSADSGMGSGVSGLADATVDQAYLSAQVTSLQAVVGQLKQRTALVTDPAVRGFAAEVQGTLERELTEAKRLSTPPARPAGP